MHSTLPWGLINFWLACMLLDSNCQNACSVYLEWRYRVLKRIYPVVTSQSLDVYSLQLVKNRSTSAHNLKLARGLQLSLALFRDFTRMVFEICPPLTALGWINLKDERKLSNAGKLTASMYNSKSRSNLRCGSGRTIVLKPNQFLFDQVISLP
jgi:hypothetical protein